MEATSEPAGRPPLHWAGVQQRARALHAWDAKCDVEEAAVRQLETEAHAAMEAATGRKAALMEELQHLCREEAAVKQAERALAAEADALAAEAARAEEQRLRAAERLQGGQSTNVLRQRDLRTAQRAFAQAQERRAGEVRRVRDEIGDMEKCTRAVEVDMAQLAQRLSDHERRLALDVDAMCTAERARLTAVERQVAHLLSALEGVEES